MKYTKLMKNHAYLILLLITGFPAQATIMTTGCVNTNISCTLTELLGGGQIAIGDPSTDVVFDNWVFDPTNSGGGPLVTDTVVVSGFDEVPDGMDPTKAFVGLNFTATPAISFGFLEYDFNFDVSISGSMRMLTQATLEDLTSTIGDGFVEVNGVLVGAGLLETGNPGPGNNASAPLASLTSLTVDADIQMENFDAPPNSPDPTLSAFNFRFQVMDAQQPPQVPEPASLALLGVGLFAMVVSRRRMFV